VLLHRHHPRKRIQRSAKNVYDHFAGNLISEMLMPRALVSRAMRRARFVIFRASSPARSRFVMH